MTIAQIMASIRQDVGDPNGVHPLWTDTVLTNLTVHATRRFSHDTGCLSASTSIVTVAGTNRYVIGGEAIVNTPETAYIAISSTYNLPLEYREPYSVPTWAQQSQPRFWSVQSIQGYRWLMLMPTPSAVWTVYITGRRMSLDQFTSAWTTDIPDALMEGPKQRVMCRMFQITGDIVKAAEARNRYWTEVRRTRQAYSRAVKV